MGTERWNDLFTTLLLAVSVATISMTITRSKMFEAFRAFVARRSAWLGHLIRCPYCTSHWISFAVVALYRPRLALSELWPVDLLLSAFILVALAAPVEWMLIRIFDMKPDAG